MSEDKQAAEAADLQAAVDGEAAATAGIAGCVARMHRAQAAKVALAGLSASDLRQVLASRRRVLGGERR